MAEKETRCGSEATDQPRLDVIYKCHFVIIVEILGTTKTSAPSQKGASSAR